MDLPASVPSFGAGSGLWAMALALISGPSVFPIFVRLLGFAAAILFAVTAAQIFAGTLIRPYRALCRSSRIRFSSRPSSAGFGRF